MPFNLGIIRCGKIAYALAKGMVQKSNLWKTIFVNDIDQERVNIFKSEFGTIEKALPDLVRDSDVIIMAVKPDQANEVFNQTQGTWTQDKLLVSVMAGVKLATLERLTGNFARVIRVMPNTPCLVNSGITAISRGRTAVDEDVLLVKELFGTVGNTVMVEEKLMDAVTAVSGSGPAYIFLVAESMVNAAVNVGLDIGTARSLVLQTLKGSALLLEISGKHPAVLREEVCSPAGTTIAGVKCLEEAGIRGAFFQAIEEAFRRSIELGKN